MKHLILVVLFLFPLSVNADTAIRIRRQITNKQVKITKSPVVDSRNAVLKSTPRSDSTDLHVQGFVSEAWSKVPDYQEYKTIGKYKHRQVIASIYFGESNYGKYDECRKQGKFNGFGWGESVTRLRTIGPNCYPTFDAVVTEVNKGIDEWLAKGMTYNQINCLYITGRAVEECNTSYKLTSIKL